jgi:predicted nucleotidyltransferase
MTNHEWTPLLSGVVGSHAYGLATPTSDVDRLVFAAAPTSDFFGLHPIVGARASKVSKNPDITVHEIGKAVALLLKCNPTVTELLYLDDWDEVHEYGKILIARREAFLSAPLVRAAYLGYATAQLRKLQHEREADDEIENRRHREKNARHLRRLLDQGVQLYTTAQLTVRVADPDELFDFGRRAALDPRIAEPYLRKAEEVIEQSHSPLGERPNEDFAQAFLEEVRAGIFVQELQDPGSYPYHALKYTITEKE